MNRLDGALGIRAVLAGARATAWMVRNFNQRQISQTEKFRLGTRQLHED
jgi:hypothetical protein